MPFAIIPLLLLVVACVYGWVMNVVAIIAAASDPLTGLFILRCVGVFVAPLGMVLGYV